MPHIINYGPQSSWERGTGGTNCFLRDDGPLLHQLCLKSLHSWVGRGAGLGLHDWPDGEVQRVKVRAPCRPGFLAYEWGDFPLNPSWTGWSLTRERVQTPVAGTRDLLGSASWPRAAGNPPKCRRCSADSRSRHKKQRGPPGLCDGHPNHYRLRILASGDDPSLCRWRGSSNSVILLVYHLLDAEFLLSVNTRFSNVPPAISRMISLHFGALMDPWFALRESSSQCSILKGFTPRSSPNTWCMVDLTPAAVAKVLHLRRGLRRRF